MHFVKIPAGLTIAGADPVNLVGAISIIFGSQVSLQVHYCKTDEVGYTSQHCCHKTMDDQIALYRECCFPNCKKSW